MIRNEQNKTARILCDGCREQTMLYPDLKSAVLELALIGWRDLGAGMTRCGRPFREICPECFQEWKASIK